MNLLRHLSLIALCALALAAPHYALARPQKGIVHQMEDIPLDRVIRNLEQQAKRNPTEAWTRLDLARAHALVYALGSSKATVAFDRGNINNVPQASTASVKYSEAGKELRAHLHSAIVIYGETLDLIRPNDMRFAPAHLGRGWCYQQMGNKRAAIADYRILLKKYDLPTGRMEESKPASAWSDLEYEAAGYLLQLLDPARDADEIAQLLKEYKIYQDILNKRRRRSGVHTPIAIPLAKDTPLADIEDRDARVAFDTDASQSGQHWSWITPRAGWLIYDPRQTGKITSGIHLFGSSSYWLFWDNGYQAMAALDDNGDGVLSGKELKGLAVWVDANRNGICDPGEIRSLASLGIKSLSYSHVPLQGHPDHIVYSPQGVAYQDGSTGPSYDIILHSKE